jgi:predicted amidohydrolase YtcJ
VDGHALLVNSAAMRAAGVTAATPAPTGGRIENGMFVDNARGLIEQAIPVPTAAERDEALAKAQEILLGYGVTAVGSMSTSLEDWEAMKRAANAARPTVRFMVYADGLDPLKAVPAPTTWLYGDRLRMVGARPSGPIPSSMPACMRSTTLACWKFPRRAGRSYRR